MIKTQILNNQDEEQDVDDAAVYEMVLSDDKPYLTIDK
jgi:hypothetical protein